MFLFTIALGSFVDARLASRPKFLAHNPQGFVLALEPLGLRTEGFLSAALTRFVISKVVPLKPIPYVLAFVERISDHVVNARPNPLGVLALGDPALLERCVQR